MKSNLSIHNTLTRKKEAFVPLKAPFVGLYVCGPTVYGDPHLGHARPAVTFDLLFRYLKASGYKVRYVRNITDVGHLEHDADDGEDKITKKARLEQLEPMEVAHYYTERYHRAMDALGVLSPSIEPRASGHIIEQEAFVQKILDAGYAYESNGSVYFDVEKYDRDHRYGVLSGRNLEDIVANTRALDGQCDKRNCCDFALWKKASKEHIMRWPSPWSDGRPGWHIECSVMAKKYLGEEIDIHAGGEDLVFPHHENEIAQSECCNGKIFSRYWLHNAFLNIDNRKMSKSLGNFFTVREISEKYDLQVLRFFMLSAHYRSPLNFSADLMESAKTGLARICNAADSLKHYAGAAKEAEMTAEEMTALEEAKNLAKKFDDAMDDDFNTADAISVVFELVRLANSNVNEDGTKAFVQSLLDELLELGDILGLVFETKEEILDEEIEKLIEERQVARKERNFQRADEIRAELLEKGIVLEDTREGVKWKRA